MQVKRNLLSLAVSAALFAPLAAQAESLDERIEYLEASVELAEAANEEMRQELDRAMKVSGYADVEYIVQEGKNSAFRMHHLSLFFQKKLSDKWKFFSEIEYEDAPKFEAASADYDDTAMDAAGGKIFLEAVNFDYVMMPEAILRFGRFFTPAGIWSVDHYPPFVATQERPGHIRKIFPQLIDGAMAYGTLKMGGSFLNYDAFVGNGENATAKSDNNNSRSYGVKGSLVTNIPGLDYTELGGTYYQDLQNDKGAPEVKKTSIGAHAKLRMAELTFQSEAAYAKYDQDVGSTGTKSGYYAQLTYAPSDWAAGYRFDNYDSDRSVDGEKETNTVFVNYRFTPNLVTKVEHHMIDDAGEDKTKTVFSIVAYLE